MQEIAPFLDYLADSAPAAWLAGSADLRTAVTAVHALSATILVGAVVPFDLRLIGFWRSVPLADISRVLGRTVLVAFAVAFVTGFALFSQRPFAHSADPAFVAKIALIALAGLNGLLLRFVTAWRLLDQVDSRGTISRFRTAGCISLAAWLLVLAVMRWPQLL
ncbi:hypothetical protein [Stappia sp. ICDLI1TA098]|jgi:hypothetical protein